MSKYWVDISFTVKPVHAVRTVQVELPWFLQYKGCNKNIQFFSHKAHVSNFNKARIAGSYNFPMDIRLNGKTLFNISSAACSAPVT